MGVCSVVCSVPTLMAIHLGALAIYAQDIIKKQKNKKKTVKQSFGLCVRLCWGYKCLILYISLCICRLENFHSEIEQPPHKFPPGYPTTVINHVYSQRLSKGLLIGALMNFPNQSHQKKKKNVRPVWITHGRTDGNL